VREVIGFVVLQMLLGVAGLGVLRATGLDASAERPPWMVFGPALLAGTSIVVALLIGLVVIGVPLTLGVGGLTVLVVAAGGFGVGRWRDGTRRAATGGTSRRRGSRSARIAVGVAGLYVALGAYALARAPTRNDDARIWSLKGLSLTYYDSLRPEIFLNPATAQAHPVYPLFQPLLEALLGRAMGRPELRLLHTELWVLLICALWTVAYLLWWRAAEPKRTQVGLAFLAFLAVATPVVSNISSGYADATGAVLLATGVVTIGLWVERREPGYAWLGAVFLAAAANTKDEDTLGVVLVLLAAGATLLVRRDRALLSHWLGSAAFCAVLVLPWRIWTADHHLSDSVVPALPRALSPTFVLDRLPQLKQTADSMLTQTLSGWSWLAAIFIAVCILCLTSGTARSLACFYLAAFVLLVAALLWLYTTTPVNLEFLLTTSMSRTVTVYMALATFASAHLLTRLIEPALGPPAGPPRARPGSPRPNQWPV
jgi:hypothetical protein